MSLFSKWCTKLLGLEDPQSSDDIALHDIALIRSILEQDLPPEQTGPRRPTPTVQSKKSSRAREALRHAGQLRPARAAGGEHSSEPTWPGAPFRPREIERLELIRTL